MHLHRLSRAAALLSSAALVSTAGCHVVGGNRGPLPAPDAAASLAASHDPAAFYRQAGFLASSGDVPFIGSARPLAGPSPDSTLVVVAFSMPNAALTFTREDERYRAAYDVVVEAHRDSALLLRTTGHEEVRVATLRETTRSEESVIFQQSLVLSPGPVALDVTVRDGGSTHAGSAHLTFTVPRFGREGLAAVAVYEARPRTGRRAAPELTANPRATVVFGRDSLLTLYLEAYDLLEPYAIKLTMEREGERAAVADTVPMASRAGGIATGIARLPVERLGLGLGTLVMSPVSAGGSVRIPVVVSFGEGLAIGTFDDMVSYLRYFASDDRLEKLRATPPSQRLAAWMTFLKETDATPDTPEHETLRAYFDRLQRANERYAEPGTPGWLTDRGAVFATLGEPDNATETPGSDDGERGRTLVWEYSTPHARLVFVDPGAIGAWRLTAASQNDFAALARRVRQ